MVAGEWQERVTRESPPNVLIEHVLRYRAIAKLARESGTWIDLGCGSGVAAREGIGDPLPPEIVLVDSDREALRSAAELLGSTKLTAINGDLADRTFLSKLAERLERSPLPLAISAFEVVEHLEDFVPLVEFLRDQREQREATVVLSVPNDAFWPLDNPFHKTLWGASAFEELRHNLPPDHVVIHQLQISGSALVAQPQLRRIELELHARLDPSVNHVPTHMLAAFGPRTDLIEPQSAATPLDLIEQRRWENEREANLIYAENLALARGKLLAETERSYQELRAAFARAVEERDRLYRLVSEGDHRTSTAADGSEEQPPEETATSH